MKVFEGGLDFDVFTDKHLTIEATSEEQEQQIIELLKTVVSFGAQGF